MKHTHKLTKPQIEFLTLVRNWSSDSLINHNSAINTIIYTGLFDTVRDVLIKGEYSKEEQVQLQRIRSFYLKYNK